MSINRWMDKDDVVHIYNGILLSLKIEWNNAMCSNMDGPRDYHTKWSKSDRERQISYDITYTWNLKKKKKGYRDFPGGPVVKNPPSSAGDAGSIPGRRNKIPHAAGQLSPCITTTKPAHHNYWARTLWRPCTTTREKSTCHNERSHVPRLFFF